MGEEVTAYSGSAALVSSSAPPDAVILSAMDSPSSLELFLLAAVEEGCATAYDLHAQAGLSVGSTQPALQRMVKEGWLAVETAGGRRRMQHRLTAKGRKELASWKKHVDHAIEKPPTDVEGLFRLMSITWRQGERRRLKKLLLAFALASTGKDSVVVSVTTITGFHRWLLDLRSAEERHFQLRLIKVISSRIKEH